MNVEKNNVLVCIMITTVLIAVAFMIIKGINILYIMPYAVFSLILIQAVSKG